VNRNTVNVLYRRFKITLDGFQEEQKQKSSGEFELDESYFGSIKKKIDADEGEKEEEEPRVKF